MSERAPSDAPTLREGRADAAAAETHTPGDPPTASQGTVIAGRYRVLEHLGHGATGDVYRVLDLQLGEQVALKTLSRLAMSSELSERFRDEVRIARKVTHKNIARTHDFGVDGGVPFLTMELVRGDSLRKRIATLGALPLEEAQRVAAELAHGLAAAHDAGVIHRDLKPANVMCAPDGRVVIIDFGLALPVAEAERADKSGTFTYMSPEQLAGHALSPASDVYALGLILFEAIAGVRPFMGPLREDRIDARLHRDAPPLDRFVRCDPALARLVADCLAREPDKRPTAHLVGERVRALAASPRDLDDTLVDIELAPAPADHACTIAVLPFRAPPEDAFIADSIADTLIDQLAQMRSARVLTASTLRAFGPGADPRVVGREVGADVVLEGRVERVPSGFALRTRLVDAETGRVILSDRAEARLGALLTAQEGIARRTADALRLGISIHAHGDVPDEAVRLYLTARAHVRQGDRASESEIVALLDRCLALAPGFPPAAALRALAVLRAWLLPQPEARDWQREAELAVALAQRTAPRVAETWIAVAMWSLQQDRTADACDAIERALALAPGSAAAHETLGRMYLEAGDLRRGAREVRIASELDPSHVTGLAMLARAAALHDRRDEAERLAARAAHRAGPHDPELLLQRVRLLHWRGARSELDALVHAHETHLSTMIVVRAFVAALQDAADPALEELAQPAHGLAPRRRAFLHQLAAEAYAATDRERAMAHVVEAVRLVLIDLEWLDRCPSLAPLRTDARWPSLREVVSARAAEILKR